jgi:hypothetical protein
MKFIRNKQFIHVQYLIFPFEINGRSEIFDLHEIGHLQDKKYGKDLLNGDKLLKSNADSLSICTR